MTAQHEPEARPGPISALLGSLRGALSTLLGIAQTRLEIIATELQEEIGRAATMLMLAFVAVFAAGIGLFVGALVLIFAFWETHRALVAVLVMGFFFLVSIAAWLVLRAKISKWQGLFATTLAELSRDREQLDDERGGPR